MCSAHTGKYFFLSGSGGGHGWVGTAGRQLQGKCEDTRSLLGSTSVLSFSSGWSNGTPHLLIPARAPITKGSEVQKSLWGWGGRGKRGGIFTSEARWLPFLAEPSTYVVSLELAFLPYFSQKANIFVSLSL